MKAEGTERSAVPETTPYDQLPLVDGVRVAWNCWGPGDVYGCLNRLMPERVRAARSSIVRGAVFPLDWSLSLPDPPLFGRPAIRHELRRSKNSSSLNDIVSDWNTQRSSQWDGFRHVTWDGHGHYNPDVEHGVHHWARRGVVGRAVLADVSRWRESVGRPLEFEAPDPISADDLVATLEAQSTEVLPGDVLLVRMGWISWYATTDAETRERISVTERLQSVGLSASESTAELLWNLQLAAIVADNPALEVWPQGYDHDPSGSGKTMDMHPVRLHVRLLVGLGMPIGELWDMDGLADDCAADGRYDAFLASTPINLPGGAASPANVVVVK